VGKDAVGSQGNPHLQAHENAEPSVEFDTSSRYASCGEGPAPTPIRITQTLGNPMAMNKNETLRSYFARARHDAGFRSQFAETTRLSRAWFGWAAFIFAIFAGGGTVYFGLRHGVWISSTPILCAVCAVTNFLIYDKMCERMAILASLDDMPDSSTDPALGSVAPAAGQPARPR
jgi:hypothetical protein